MGSYNMNQTSRLYFDQKLRYDHFRIVHGGQDRTGWKGCLTWYAIYIGQGRLHLRYSIQPHVQGFNPNVYSILHMWDGAGWDGIREFFACHSVLLHKGIKAHKPNQMLPANIQTFQIFQTHISLSVYSSCNILPALDEVLAVVLSTLNWSSDMALKQINLTAGSHRSPNVLCVFWRRLTEYSRFLLFSWNILLSSLYLLYFAG